MAHIAIGVFSDNERGASVLNEQITQSNLNAALGDDLVNLAGDIVSATTAGFVGERFLISHVWDDIGIETSGVGSESINKPQVSLHSSYGF